MPLIDLFSYDDVGAAADLLKMGWFDVANMAIGSTDPRTGTQYLSCGTGGLSIFNQSCWRTAGGTGADYYEYGCFSTGISTRSLSGQNWSNGENIMGFGELLTSVDWHLVLKSNGLGQVEVRRGAGGTVLATSTFPGGFQNDIWYWLEFRFRLHNSLGYIHLRVNGVDAIAMTTGLDTIHTSGNLPQGKWNEFSLGRYRLDDTHFAADNAGADVMLGDGTKIYCKFPLAEGFHNGSWAPSTGTDESDVTDETGTPNTTDYISSNTVGHKSTFTISPLGVTGTVNGVQPATFAMKNVSGDVRGYKNIVRTGSADFQGALEVFPSVGGLTCLKDMFVVNPDTTTAWTVAEVDAHEPGVELTT